MVINPPKNGQRGRLFVNGPKKEQALIDQVIAEVEKRLNEL